MSKDKRSDDFMPEDIKQLFVTKELFEKTPALIFSKEVKTGRYFACNQAFAEYVHKESPQEVIGLTDYDLHDKQFADYFIENDQITLSTEGSYTFVDEIRDDDGNQRFMQTTKVKYTNSSGALCILGISVDVTMLTQSKTEEIREIELGRRRSLQVLLKEKEKNQNELEKMITALSAEYRAVYQINLDKNEGICYRADPQDFEQTPEGIRFPYLERFTWYATHSVAKEYRDGFLAFIDPDHIRSALSKKKEISYRYLAQRIGKEYYELIRIADAGDSKTDNTVHSVSLGMSIIDKQMREALAKNNALSEALAAAQEASKAKTTFLSNMSHEIRTPMNAIIGLDSLALRNKNLPDETEVYLKKIGESASHLLGLINDILDMSRIESGRMILRTVEFSFRSMLEQINTMVMAQCTEKGLKYECKLIGGINDYYIGDDLKIKQVLINILGNAVKFTDPPGSVTLTVERTAIFENRSTLKFTITDTGIGMDASFIPKVFDTFTQEDSGRKNKYGSTGLGMAITKNIVDIMNGTIAVKSEKGVGTEFTVILTLQNSNHLGSVTDYVNPEEMLVLVIDDDEIDAEHARLDLAEIGIRADMALSGDEALRMIDLQHNKHEPYNLILLDWKMPGTDGLEVARQIRQRYGRETTVIFLTAYNWDDIMDEAVSVGVDSFLSKPLFVSNVIDEFERYARKKKLALFHELPCADLTGKRILLAEDILINAEIIKEQMKIKGAFTEHAENGKLAVEMFNASDEGYYDAILMDVRMPEMDGLEATEAIRSLDREDAKTVPIIAMTANAFDEDVQRSLQVGMNAHLSKPVEPERLYRTLGELIYQACQE